MLICATTTAPTLEFFCMVFHNNIYIWKNVLFLKKIYFLKILQCIKCSCCGENIVWRTSSYKKWIKFTKNLSSLHEKSVLHVNIYKLSLIYLKRKYKKTIIWKNYMIFSKSKKSNETRKMSKKTTFFSYGTSSERISFK